jgi:carbonic anhydrase
MFEVGDKADPVLQLLMDNYKPGTNYTTSIDLSHLLNNAKPIDYWFYLGSPTIPPCRLGTMNWIISKRVFSMNQEQRDFFYNLFNNDKMDGNWRNLQSIKDNPVSFYQLAFQ